MKTKNLLESSKYEANLYSDNNINSLVLGDINSSVFPIEINYKITKI